MARTGRLELKRPAVLDPEGRDSLRWMTGLWIITAVIFITLYLIHPSRPSASAPGWWGWWDQGQYRVTAQALVDGRLDRGSYQYPIGYPLLGVPFVKWMPTHTFFLPTLLCVVLAAHFLYEIGRPFLTRVEAAVLALAALFAHPLIGSSTLVPPSNNTPILAAALAVTALFVVRGPRANALWTSAVLLPFLFHIRTLEWLVLSALAVSALVLRREWKALVQFSAVYLGVFLIYFAAIGWITIQSTGEVLPPYMTSTAGVGFFSYPFVPKAYLTMFATDSVVDGAQSLAQHFPWMLLVLPGAVFFARAVGATAWALFGAIALMFVAYIGYNDLWPSMLFRFQNQRYFGWPLTLGLLFAYLTFRQAWRALPRAAWVPLLVAPSLAYAVRLDPAGDYERLVTTASPDADRLTFTVAAPVDSTMDFVRLYGVTANGREIHLEADGRPLAAYQDFFLMDYTDPRHLVLAHPVARQLTLDIPAGAMPGRVLNLSKGRLRWRLRWSGASVVARRYEPGATIDFANPDSTIGYLQDGFSSQEDGFRWSDGPSARLALRVPVSTRPFRLAWSAQSFGRQRVRVDVNGVTVGDTVLTGSDLEERTFPLLPDLPVREGLYEIRFHFVDAARPSDRIGTDDGRLLGLAFRWLRMDSGDVVGGTTSVIP